MSNESTLQKPIGRAQSFAILGGFTVLIVLALILLSSRMKPGVSGDVPARPVEVSAVISQGDEAEATPPVEPTPSTHEQAVRQEYLQTLRDKAAAN